MIKPLEVLKIWTQKEQQEDAKGSFTNTNQINVNWVRVRSGTTLITFLDYKSFLQHFIGTTYVPKASQVSNTANNMTISREKGIYADSL